MKYVSPEAISGCWLWTGSVDKNGYGYFKVKNKTHKAHRISYSLFNGNFTDEWVLHRCDNPSCVNPQHLFLGTALTNNLDMIAKGRAYYPGCSQPNELNPNVKLSKENVEFIRREYRRGMYKKFAEQFGVCVQTIGRIVRGDNWRRRDVIIMPEIARYKDVG